MDDQKARRVAKTYGVESTTSLGLMLELLLAGVLPKSDYLTNIGNYSAQGWISADVLQEFIARGEELG
jgi:predicted nucleic acid-binding protein